MVDLLTAAGVGTLLANLGQNVVGSILHEKYREVKQHLFDRFPNLSGLPSNHDVARAVRLAQLQGLHHFLRGIKAASVVADAAFVVRAEAFVGAEFRALRDIQHAEPTLETSIEAGFDAMNEAFTPAKGVRTEDGILLGQVTEDAVLDELAVKVGVVPDDFAHCFRGREPSVMGWFAAYSVCLAEQVKVNDRFRNILIATLLTGHSAQLRRIETILEELRQPRGDLEKVDPDGAAERARGGRRAVAPGQPIAPSQEKAARRGGAPRTPQTGALARTFLGEPEGVFAIALSPDGKRIASGEVRKARGNADEKPGRVRIWEADTGRLLAEKADLFAPARTMVFSPDGKLLAVPREVLDGHSAERIAVTGDLNAFSPDGKELVTTLATQLHVYDTEGWKLLRTIESHVVDAKAFALSQNGRWIACADWDKQRGSMIPCTIRIVDATNGQLLRVLPPGQDLAHDGAITTLAFSNDTVFSFGADREIVAWNAETAEVAARFVPTLARLKRIVYTVGIIAGALLAARAVGQSEGLLGHIGAGLRGFLGSFLSDVFIVAAVGAAIASMIYLIILAARMKFGGRRQGVVHRWTWSDPSALALSPDGRSIATGHSNGSIEVWDARNGRTITAFRGRHRKAVLSLAFSADGSRLVSGSQDGTINVWRA